MRLADFILANIEPILAEWEVFARDIWPNAAGGATDPATLRDDAENMLRAAVMDMQSDQTTAQQSDKSKGKGDASPHQARVDRVSSLHGSGRYGSGFDMPAVIAEYRALRASVLGLWSESLPDPHQSNLKDLTRFNESVDQSQTEAVLVFSNLIERERQAALAEQLSQAQKVREMNDALLVSSVRQHELNEQAKIAEMTLRESEERFRTITDNLPQLTWMADGEGYLDWFNRGWLDYTGTTLEDNQGVGWKRAHHPDCVDKVAEKFERHLREGRDWEDTFPLRGKDGRYRWFLSRMNAIRDPSGKVVRFFGTNTDVTDQLEMEHRIRQQAESLADLHRRKDEFLAMLSHELRNPLSPILNAVQILRLQGGDDPLQKQARTIIERQVGQLKRLIDDLLEISRINSGRVQLRQDRILATGIIDRAVETARPLIDQRRHELTVTGPTDPIWLFGDATRLEQVLVNLLTNAAKYTGNDGRICLSVQQEGTMAVFRVRDTGVGIAPELLPHIFDLFTQAERSLDRSEGGLGIGLALVRRLVELHHGTVDAHSTPGKGSEFVVCLPVADSSTVSSPAADTRLTLPSGSRRVLVVDDNVDAAESLAHLLRASKHEVRTAHDGPTAVKAAVDFRPDVMLLDIGLPGLDGYEVAKRVRRESSLDGVVLVAMTGYGQDSDKERSHAAGFDHHLVKPADFGQVKQILATMSPGAAGPV